MLQYSFSRFVLDVLLSRWLPAWLGGTPRSYTFLRTPLTRERADKLLELVDQGMSIIIWYLLPTFKVLVGVSTSGKLHVPIDSVYSFKDVRKAYARTMTGRATGKILVRVE